MKVAYYTDMRIILLRFLIVLLVSTAILVPTLTSFPLQEEISWIDTLGSATVSFLVLALLLVMQHLYSNVRIQILIFSGLLIYYVGILLDTIDEIILVNRASEIAEGIALPLGILVSMIGFFFLIRDQRKIRTVLEENKATFEKLSITDELTGLFNSRHFYEQLQSEMQRSQRYERPLSILLLDIDDFKKHNDTYGHIEGDRVLRKLGKLITSVLREHDSGYRYGGEEFTAILPETSEDQALIVAERIREDFKAAEFTPAGEIVSKTISVGVAEFAEKDEISVFIKKADEAMYLAKRQGKDQVAVFAESTVRRP